jgi:poly-gamma-glutamate capsule biosynthesis protein CapA/YwtB (metallophosphatase superfamily)
MAEQDETTDQFARAAEARAPGSAAETVSGLLTRRELLVAAAAVTVSVAACAPVAAHDVRRAPTPSPTPFALDRPATLFADGAVPGTFARAAAARLSGVAGIPRATLIADHISPDLILTYGSLPPGYRGVAVGASASALVTHLRVPVDNVTLAQARALLSGASGNWAAAGAPSSLGVRVFALDTLPLPASLTLAAHATRLPTVAALLDAIRAQPGSLALVPAEVADWSVRNLGVAGVYPIQGRGTAQAGSSLPALTLTLGVSDALAARGLKPADVAAALTPLLAAASPALDMLVVGDIMLGRAVNAKMVGSNDYLYPFRQIHSEFQGADLRVANLECTVTDLYPVPTDPFTFTFVTAKRAVEGLAYAGLSAVTVANNHADGPGPGPLLDMIATLRDKGIAVCGGGNTLDEARAPAIVSARGMRVALLGYDMIPPQGAYATDGSPGLAPVDLETLPRDIAAARAKADLVIPYFHWGIEYTKVPTIDQQRTARAAIDAGADMVLGNHPHWVQGIESYKGRLIVYSFGNFVFDQDWSRPTREGVMIHLYWRGTTLAGIRIVPVLDENRCQPRILAPAESMDIFDRMWSGTDLLAAGQYGPEPEG